MKKNRVSVIGSGFAGLSVASGLAKEGYAVTVFEKNATPGGRARSFSANGFTFDMGPSWYWMPDVFENYFAHFGKSVSDYYSLKRLDPSYSVFFGANDRVDLPAAFDKLCELFETIEMGSASKLKKFLDDAAYKYRVGMQEMVFKPSDSWLEYADWRVIASSFRLHMFTSLAKEVEKHFKNPKLRKILEFPVLFLGAQPTKTPAMYSLMNYADIKLGTWYPEGGMIKIVDGMVTLAKELGVTFKTNHPVAEICVENNHASGVIANGTFYPADVVISTADYHHTDQNLLEAKYRNYNESYWQSRTMAPSSLLYYLGLNEKVNGIEHHNLFFDTDFEQHASEIYDKPDWPENPLFYVSATSKTDPGVAPEGGENLFILIPTAAGLEESEAISQKYFDIVIDRMEFILKQDIRSKIVYRRDFGCTNFMEEYNSFKGNAYGLANTLRQTAVLKPKLKNRKLENMYYAGQLTVPGPGVPPSLISGRIVAREVCKSHKI